MKKGGNLPPLFGGRRDGVYDATGPTGDWNGWYW
ncbi:hypothetical protein R11007_00772 [Ralstonia holmesii]|nr:hypothetical protein R11007_00772 [Ralstonia sp. LMG 32967]